MTNIKARKRPEAAPFGTTLAPGSARNEALPTLAEQLRSQLERLITSAELPPGSRLDEQEIAQRFQVSRTPVREAFRLLAAQRLVTLRGRQGAAVTWIDTHELLEMFVVMAELEGLCARLACRRMTPETLTRIRTLNEQLLVTSQAKDIDLFFEANRDFHDAIYDASCNTYLAAQTRELRNQVSAYRRRMNLMPGRITSSLDQHHAMRAHVDLAGDDLMDFIAWSTNAEAAFQPPEP